MKKALIYYQFDIEKYYSDNFDKGYFDCNRDGFGPVIEEEGLISQIGQYMYKEDNRDKYIKRAE